MPLNIANNYPEPSNNFIQDLPAVKIKDLVSPVISRARRKTQNEILANLSPDLYARLEPLMQKESFYRGQPIYQAESKIKYVYFPDNLVASRLTLIEGKPSAEAGMIGPEGILGIRTLVEAGKTQCLTIAENEGTATKMEAEGLKELFRESMELRNTFSRFYEGFLIQISQKAVCRSTHTLSKQVCTWLLQFQERTTKNELSLTLDTIADRLGSKPSTIRTAIDELVSDNIISCGKETIEIIDREALGKRICECYAVMQCESLLRLSSAFVH